jgi:hypothetical protein
LSRIKRHAVLALLIEATLWPAVQISLVRRYGVNPWKLAGWGMYAAPQLPGEVRTLGHTPDEIGNYELSTSPEELDEPLLEFLRRRRGVGDLAKGTC